MTLQDLGSIGELLGAIATVATLAYLAVQVRQNSAQMREATRVAQLTLLDRTVEAFSRYRALLAQPGISELFTRGLESYSTLSPPEKLRFRSVIEEYFFAYSATLERVAQDAYDNSTWNAQATGAASLLRSPGGAEWWAERRTIYNPEFVAEMDRLAASESGA